MVTRLLVVRGSPWRSTSRGAACPSSLPRRMIRSCPCSSTTQR